MNRIEKWHMLKTTKKGLMVDYLAVPEADKKLKQYLGVSTEKELLDAINSDFYYYSVRDISQNEGFMKCYQNSLPVSETRRQCALGITWNRGAYDSKFAVDEAVDAPLKHVTSSEEILRYPFPTPELFDFTCLLEEAEQHKDRVKIGGLWTGIMGDSYRMYGFERFLTDIALEPDLIHTLIDKLTDVYLALNNKYFETMKGNLDIWFFGNDFGSQMGLLMSETMWCEYFYDNIKRLCDLAKSYGITVMMHSCGGIRPIIPHLIRAGVEILDPIQITAKDMQPDQLAEAFGDALIFHGALDTQQILPYGSPEDVKRETHRLLSIMKDKGYIFAPSQVLNKDVPAENMASMYQAVRDAVQRFA